MSLGGVCYQAVYQVDRLGLCSSNRYITLFGNNCKHKISVGEQISFAGLHKKYLCFGPVWRQYPFPFNILFIITKKSFFLTEHRQ